MSNILNHNRLPFKCKLSYKDYWDFHLHLGREYGTVLPGINTDCLAAFIDTELEECRSLEDSLVSTENYRYTKCNSKGVNLENFGLTGMDNGFIRFNKETITNEEFDSLLKTTHLIEENDCRLHVYPIGGNNSIYSYGNEIVDLNGVKCAKLTGGFFQGFFRSGNGCDYSVLPSDIGDGWSLEFELYRKDIPLPDEKPTLNGISPSNKGIFFYLGARSENKWVRYYGEECDEEKQPDETNMKTVDGSPLDRPTFNQVETSNKFLTYTRVCGGHTVLDDKEEENEPIVKIDSANTILPDNPFLIYSRTCGGTTALNDDKYFKEHSERYNIYNDLWQNAIAFQVTDDGKVGYKYLVKDCDEENASCSYKILSEFSNTDNVPYCEWVNIHVRVLPCGTDSMRLLFYVNGRLVLYSKELPKLNLRELHDSSDKQEGVPFNISLGGGTQGLADVVYEDFKTFYETNYPLKNEFGGSFIGYFKSFKFYECSLNYTQIKQNTHNELSLHDESKIYCGIISFNEKPSITPIEQQSELIPLLNAYPDDSRNLKIRLFRDITKRYVRITVAVPTRCRLKLEGAYTSVNGLNKLDGASITPMFTHRGNVLIHNLNEYYDIWYCTYASPTMINNTITIDLSDEQ